MNKKRMFGVLAAALVVAAVTVGGVVFAQSPSPSTQPSPGQGQANQAGRSRMDDFLNQLAQNLHIGRPALDDALKTTAKQQVESAVSSGRLTRDRANRIEQRIDSGQFPVGFGRFGEGRGGPMSALAGCGADTRQAVLSSLGVSADELRQARQNGQTISQIAQAHGKTEQDLQTAMTNALTACLDKQVQAGTLTKQQEQDILQRIQQHRGGAPGAGRRGNTSQSAPRSNQGQTQ